MASLRGAVPSRCSFRRVHVWVSWAGAAPLILSALTGTVYRLARSAGAEKEQVRWLMDLHTLRTFGLRWIYPLLLMSLVAALLLTGATMTAVGAWLRRALCGTGRQQRSGSGSRSLNHAVEQFERRQASLRGLINGGGGGGGSEAGAPVTVSAADEESEWSEADETLVDSAFLSRRIPSAVGASPRWTVRQRVAACLPRAFTWRWLHRALGTAALLPLLLTAATGGAYVWCADWLFLEKSEYRTLMYLHEGRYLESSGTLYVALLGSAVLALSAAGAVLLWGRVAAGAAQPFRYVQAPSVAYSGMSGGGGGGVSAGGSLVSPSSAETRHTMARIQKAFDIHNVADDTEDEMLTPHE